MLNKETITIGDRECILFYNACPKCLLVQPVDEHDMEGMENELSYIVSHTEGPFALAAVPVNNWNKDISPWAAPAVFGNDGFGSGASETLRFISGDLLAEVFAKLNVLSDIPIILGGYSLAALFSLWSAYQTDRFAAVCAASPSVWFPGWIDYAASHPCLVRNVYLSLGDKEEKARNKIMATVGDCIRKQSDLLEGSENSYSVLEWNTGNHFKEPDIRTAKGFVWCIKRLEARND